MCTTCGCGDATGAAVLDAGATRVAVPGLEASRCVTLEADLLAANDAVAARNRAWFAAHGVTAVNLMASPGAGKTTLLCATLRRLRELAPQRALAVIEGDQATALDAERIRACGVPAVQVNTGKGCHLDAPMVAAALQRLHGHFHAHDQVRAHDPGYSRGLRADRSHPHEAHHGEAHAAAQPEAHHHPVAPEHGQDGAGGLLFIENVGNLVCPALWDLGERARVVLLSVPEGDDKPLKYPDMFARADLLLITKADLLPHVPFDVEACVERARRLRPGLPVLLLSAASGQGLQGWCDWLLAAATPASEAAPAQAETG